MLFPVGEITYVKKIPSGKMTDDHHKWISKSTVFGPGNWDINHAMAFRARDKRRKEGYIDLIQCTRENMRCLTCKEHMTKYLEKNPIEEWMDLVDEEGRPLGCFYWSVEFHNSVNQRLGKKIMSRGDAYKLYNGEIIPCSKDCADGHDGHEGHSGHGEVKKTFKLKPYNE